MGARNNDKLNSIRNYERLLEKQVGKAVRPFRADSYVNLLNKYGTSKDTSEHYHFQQEPPVPDDMLTAYYEGNGLFAKIIDTPAEEAVKHGFELEADDQTITGFYTEALDELDWEEKLMTAIKWTRLFGGCIVVMLIDDGRGLDEPLDWQHIKSIDDLRIYDRSLIQEDTSSMFDYRPDDPFRAKGSRLGMPEYYDVFSKYGNFRVHDSRCLVFQNGTLPENTTNSIYQLWGMPEYVRINKAIRDAEVAHGSAIKLLDRSVQAVYRMKDLSAELATAEGEDRVLRRLQTIDMARGLLNSITIDADGEDYGFQTFQFSGVSTVVDSACNYLSALTSIPQTLLFGRSPAGMNSTGESDLENWYNYVERIQSRMIKKNLRYLLSIIFQAGVANGEIDEVPEIKIEFNPLWSMSESEKAAVEQQKAATQQTKAQTAQIYMDAQVIDPSEVRRKLADSGEFDVETMLDEYDEEELFENMPQGEDDEMMMGGEMPPTEQVAEETEGTEQEVQESEQAGGNTDSTDTLPNLNKPSQQSAKRMDNNLSTQRRQTLHSDEGNANSGNWGHEGRPGKIGGSSPSSSGLNSKVSSAYKSGDYSSVGKSIRSALKDMPSGSTVTSNGVTYRKVDDNKFEYEVNGRTMTSTANAIANGADLFNESNAPVFEVADAPEPDGFADHMSEYIGGGYDLVEALEDSDVKYIEDNMESTSEPLYRVEESKFTSQRLTEPGQEFSFTNDLRSFTRSEEVADSFMDENDDYNYAYHRDPVIFKTTGTTQHFSVEDYAKAYPVDQQESIVGGKFKVVDISTHTTKDGQTIPMYTIEQVSDKKDGISGGNNPSDTAQNSPKATKTDANGEDNNLSTPPQECGSVGVLVVKDGNILTGTRKEGFKRGQICGPGGHVEDGESLEEAAIRETQEEFGITPTDMVLIGYGPTEKDTGLKPAIFLATEYEGEIANTDGEIGEIAFRDMGEIDALSERLFKPFKDSCKLMVEAIGDDIKATKPNDLLTPDELFRKFTKMMPNNAINKPKLPDKTPQPCYNKDIPTNPYRQAFQSLSAEDIAYMMDEFGIDVGAATDDELIEVVAKLREDGGEGSGNWNHKGVEGQRGGSAPKGSSVAITNYKTRDGKIEVTSDLAVKASKSGKSSVKIKAGQSISDIYTFAGSGSDQNLVMAGTLAKQYGGKPNEWSHKCGFATVEDDEGNSSNAEIHWFENPEVGQIKFKVKKR